MVNNLISQIFYSIYKHWLKNDDFIFITRWVYSHLQNLQLIYEHTKKEQLMYKLTKDFLNTRKALDKTKP